MEASLKEQSHCSPRRNKLGHVKLLPFSTASGIAKQLNFWTFSYHIWDCFLPVFHISHGPHWLAIVYIPSLWTTEWFCWFGANIILDSFIPAEGNLDPISNFLSHLIWSGNYHIFGSTWIMRSELIIWDCKFRYEQPGMELKFLHPLLSWCSPGNAEFI